MAFEKSKLSSLPPPPNDECSPRPKVRSCDLCVGCIVWLPSDSCDKSVKCCKKNCCGKVLGEDAYNSPVVVLKIRQRKGSSVRGDIMCYVANITTFNDMPLQTYLSECHHNPSIRHSLPISPVDQDSCIEATPSWLLRIQKGSLKKQSYIDLSHIFKIPASHLHTYAFRSPRAYKLRLSATSYSVLMAEIGLRNEPYEDTASLYKTARTRLEALARTNREPPSENPQKKVARVRFCTDDDLDVHGKKYPITPFPFAFSVPLPLREIEIDPQLPLKERRNVRFTLEGLPRSKSARSRSSGYGTMLTVPEPLATPYPTAPPTPQTARYQSFSPYVDHGWRDVAVRFLMGCLGLGGLIGVLRMWGGSVFGVAL
ncbi:hypothetical protein CJF30_00007198 [Rutstroemia sp. NJR-2017a BBW]|nr:hypothetical protein CJF30_00007198 [Rutstroemia sp. NJR-2017a BBW]